MNKLLCKVASIDTPPAKGSPKIAYKRLSSSIYIRDLVIDMSIGLYDHERKNKQPIKINIEAVTNTSDESWRAEDLSQVTDYEPLVVKIREIANKHDHIELIETFADMIAEAAMALPFVTEAHIQIEKPSIFEDARGAGIKLHVTKA